ncbi:MAG: YggS family pyridoxal phosphate-dependent enzyme [Defluviitaleaceae bacterium]|nr:YggS family pyridoxal phosphate-dependent enzyme [Defluviitaleaceae bacterium]
MSHISENVRAVRKVISESAKKAGRDPAEIKLIGVTKTVDTSRINELLAAGVTEIGENRVQDMLPKYEYFFDREIRPREWHFIGHLQRNKVKFIVGKVDLIHSVDSLALAEEINKRAETLDIVQKILIEVNISSESSKFGIPPSEILELAKKLEKLRFLRLSGLMCVAPFVENAEENRGNFTKMRNLSVDIQERCHYDTISRESSFELSMGMTGDYSVAVEEGATMIRIGTALFGERIKTEQEVLI